MFGLGDKIVYPMHGAGVIETKTEKEVLGKVDTYYILKMPITDLKISIPKDKINNIGVRLIEEESILAELDEIIDSDFKQISTNWNSRHSQNQNKLKTGDLKETVTVFRDLYTLDAERGLSMIEKKLLNTAKRMLVSEISLMTDREPEDVEKEYEEKVYNRHVKDMDADI